MVKSLRDYLTLMEKQGEVLVIKERIEREDLPEVIERLSKIEKVLLFEKVGDYRCRVVANLVPSHKVFSLLFGVDDPYTFFIEGIERQEKKVLKRERAGYTTIKMDGEDLMDILPILKHYEGDSAPYITSGIVSAVDPETGVVGRGIHRMEYRGKDRLGVSLLNPPLTEIMEKYAQSNKLMPVSVVVGVDPLIFLSMALKVPAGVDKIEVAGGLKREGIEVIPSLDSSIAIPDGSEFILEGLVDYKDMQKDGPLGEVSGYYLSLEKTPTITIKTISYRDAPIYHALLPTAIEADTYLTFVSRAHMEEKTKRLFPFVTEITFIKETFGSSLVVNIRPIERQRINNLIAFLLSFPMLKKVVIVDEDVDPDDLYEIDWAIVTRCNATEDVLIIPNLQGQPIDPQAKGGKGVAKIGINATTQGKAIEKRARVIKGNKENVERIINAYGGLK
jgi:2,5-furandicarboxylate decarboxylase 1